MTFSFEIFRTHIIVGLYLPTVLNYSNLHLDIHEPMFHLKKYFSIPLNGTDFTKKQRISSKAPFTASYSKRKHIIQFQILLIKKIHLLTIVKVYVCLLSIHQQDKTTSINDGRISGLPTKNRSPVPYSISLARFRVQLGIQQRGKHTVIFH